MACCSPWGRKEVDTTQGLHSNNNVFFSSGMSSYLHPFPPPSQTQGAVGKWGFISLPLGRNSYSSDASNLINFSVFFSFK